MAILNDVRKLAGSIDLSLTAGRGRAKPRALKIVMLGAGAIGGSVAAWISERYDNLHVLDLPEVNARLRRDGLTTYLQGHRDEATTVRVRVLDDLDHAADADVLVLCVKNYSLDAIARKVRERLGDRALIVGLQNGVANQAILPKYFSRVIYGVISYNAWLDPDGAIGYQKKGPLHLGTRHNELQDELAEVTRLFSSGVETHATDAIGDAAHCKLVINLTNSLTTLVGLNFRPISDEALFQKLLTNQLHEGVQIVKAAGYRESRLGGMPPWALMTAGAKLPRLFTKAMFRRNVKKMVVSSMAQDVLTRHGTQTELETINAYLLGLARRHGVTTPYNDAIYALCTREFARPDFAPLDVTEVWREVSERLQAK
jgi:2-dehydropantoate 2-reductase